MATRITGRALQRMLDNIDGTINLKYDASTTFLSFTDNGGKEFVARLTNELRDYFKKQTFGVKIASNVPKVFNVTNGHAEFMEQIKTKGISFNNFCSYYFEIVFFQIFCAYCGLSGSYVLQDPGYQRQLAIVNAYMLRHPRMENRIKDAGRKLASLSHQAILGNSTLLQAINQFRAAGDGPSIILGETSNSPDDIIIVIGDIHINFDLKSLTRGETGAVEWIPYSSKTSEELGVHSFIGFIKNTYNNGALWRVPDGKGGIIPDEEWAARIAAGEENGARGLYIAKIAQQMTNFLAKGKSKPNDYLSNKILIINSRPPTKSGDWDIEVTVDMAAVLKILNEEASLASGSAEIHYTTEPSEIPPYWRNLGEAYILVKRMQEGQDLLPLSAFSIPKSAIERVGAQALANKKDRTYSVPIGFALNHNALVWASKSAL